MLAFTFNVLKTGAVIFYLAALASFVIEPLMGYQAILFSTIAILAIAHFAEFLVVRKKLKQIKKAAGYHLLQVMLFGFLYWIPLLYPERINQQQP